MQKKCIYICRDICMCVVPSSILCSTHLLSSKATFTFQFIFLFSFNIYFSFLCVYLPYALQQQTRMCLADIHTHTNIFYTLLHAFCCVFCTSFGCCNLAFTPIADRPSDYIAINRH